MTLSLNEIEALCAKAAKGAGRSWGTAEETGLAAGWLARNGIDGAAMVLRALEATDGQAEAELCPVVLAGRMQAPESRPLCPIATGIALSDFRHLPEGQLGEGELTLGNVIQPILLAPFLASIANTSGKAITLTTEAETGCFSPDQTLLPPGLSALNIARVKLRATDAGARSRGATARGILSPDPSVIERLSALALRTTVPPSEKSRTDAGAAADDND